MQFKGHVTLRDVGGTHLLNSVHGGQSGSVYFEEEVMKIAHAWIVEGQL